MLKYKKFNIVILTFILIFLLTFNILAASSAKAVGFGDEFVTLTGVDALTGNPAAVNAKEGNFALELGLNAEAWNNLLENGYISEAEKDDLLDGIDDGLVIKTEGRLGNKLSIGSVTTFFDIKEDGLVRLSRDAGELLLKGNEIGKEYNLEGSDGSGGIYGDIGFNLSLAVPEKFTKKLNQNLNSKMQLEKLYWGLTYHYLTGSIFKANGTGTITGGYDVNGDPDFTGDGEFTAKYADPESDLATGSTVDLGIYGEVNDKYSFGFSVLNLGSMTVNGGKTVEYNSETDDEPQEGTFSDKLEWELPTVIRLGGKMEYNKNVSLFGDYSHTSYQNGLKDHKFAAGTELNWIKFLPLRFGANYSTLQNNFALTTGAGLHLGVFKLDAGISDLTGLFNKSKGIEGSLTAKVEF